MEEIQELQEELQQDGIKFMETSTPAFIPQTQKPIAQSAPVSPPAQPQQNQASSPQLIAQKTITAHDGTLLDAGVVNLSKAIRQQESGGNYNAIGDNGTSHGAYQWQPGNFASAAKQYGLDPTDFSPTNQDKVAYAQISHYKEQGLLPEQIASMWNSGKPDPTGNVGTKKINGKDVSFDTPAYVSKVMSHFQQFKTENPGQPQAQDLLSQTVAQPQEAPSIGGFGKNVVQSGANFLGNIANAALHPIQTVQNIGGAAVGGLQELGGQQNENTQKFDALTSYFKDRYGGVDQLLHTAYTDPVGLAADISAALGVGGGIAGIAGKGAELAGLGRGALAAGGADFVAGAEGAANVARETAGSGLAGGLQSASNVAGKASEISNPLTPVIKGVGALASKGEGLAKYGASKLTGLPSNDISTIAKNAEEFTPEKIASASRANVASEIDSALQNKIESLSEVGKEYQPFREAPVPIKTTPDFLDNAIRRDAKVDITDGIIKANSSSIIRDAGDIRELQNIYNTYKTDFLNGTMDSNKLLNLRQDLAETANYNKGLTKNIQRVADDVRTSINDTYRPQIKGLAEKDTAYSTQKTELTKLRKGLLDKEGNLTDSAINKIANATGKGKDQLLARLEEISPGITKKIEIQHAMESISSMNENKVGTYTKSIVEGGGVLAGISTGNMGLVAGSIATMILASPKIAVPLIRFFGSDQSLIKAVMANLARYTTSNSVLNRASQSGNTQTSEPSTPINQGSSPQTGNTASQTQGVSSPNDITKVKGYQEAIHAGYTPEEIRAYLESHP